jgi:Mn-dependent DtxR family transcriptional regulator
MATGAINRLWKSSNTVGVCNMADSGGLSWEAQEVFQKIKLLSRVPGAGIPMIQLNMKVGSAKTVKKGIPELKSAGLITDTASGEPTLTDKGYKTSI